MFDGTCNLRKEQPKIDYLVASYHEQLVGQGSKRHSKCAKSDGWRRASKWPDFEGDTDVGYLKKTCNNAPTIMLWRVQGKNLQG